MPTAEIRTLKNADGTTIIYPETTTEGIYSPSLNTNLEEGFFGNAIVYDDPTGSYPSMDPVNGGVSEGAVSGVKGAAESSYRVGNVSINAANVLGSSSIGSNSQPVYYNGSAFLPANATSVGITSVLGSNAIGSENQPVYYNGSALVTSNRTDTVPRPNIVDNWYFVGGGSQQGGGQLPINSNGQTTLTATADGTYFVDRWCSHSPASGGTLSYSLTSAGMTIASNANNDNVWVIKQPIKNPGAYSGKTMTLSVLYSNFQGTRTRCVLAVNCSGTNHHLYSDWSTSSSGLLVASGVIYDNPTNIYTVISLGGNNPSSNIIAVKLEIGSTQTLAHQENGTWVLNEIPNYEEQLMRCGVSNNDNIGELWVWEKYPAVAAYAKHGEPSTSSSYLFRNGVSGSGNGYYVRYKASASVSVEDDGTITLDNPSTVTVYKPTNSTGAGYSELVGKYFQYYDSSSNSQYCEFNTGLFYCPADATFTYTSTSIISVTGIETITGISAKDASREQGLISYLCNNDSSSYPANGKSGDYWYIRRGQIGGAASIESVVHIGTGTYEEQNPTEITFSFVPKLVFVSYFQAEYGVYTIGFIDTSFLNSAYVMLGIPDFTSSSTYPMIKLTGTTLSFYADYADLQFNENAARYLFTAIG